MAAGFHLGSVLDDEDAIGIDNRVQTVRDHDGRTPLAEVLDCTLHLPLRFRIERCGRFVQQNDRCILEQRAGNRDALALASGNLHSMLAHLGIVAARKRRDEIVRVRRPRGGHDFVFARPAPADGNVVAHRAAEQEHVLADIGELTPQ